MDTKHQGDVAATALARPIACAALAVLVHVAVCATLTALFVRHQVSEYGLAGDGTVTLGPTMSGGIILVAIVVTAPLAAAQAWSLRSSRTRWVGVVAAALSASIHSLVGLAPLGLRFAGDVDPVTHDDISTTITSTVAIVVGHIAVLLAMAIFLQSRRRSRGLTVERLSDN